jgi:hypothetical protein
MNYNQLSLFETIWDKKFSIKIALPICHEYKFITFQFHFYQMQHNHACYFSFSTETTCSVKPYFLLPSV